MPHPLPDTPTGIDADTWADTVAEVRAFCGWHIAPEVTETVTLDGPNSSILVLPTLHLVDLVSITNDGTAVTDPEWSRTGMVRGYWWSWKFRSVVAEITHGYDEWPTDLLAVMTELASAGSGALSGVKAITSGAHQVTFETSMSRAQSDVLGRYQLPFVA